MPYPFAFWAALSAAICAANGVLFREPLNPTEPALAQATTLPTVSVIVTIVLLNVAWTHAIPWAIFLASFLPPARPTGRFGFASSAILPPSNSLFAEQLSHNASEQQRP